ncbi:B3 domain-containing protein Os07g0563300 isoform X2 [Prunus dulcis]|uniref:B3 domain-containing protein Os07g0563300 isoform X2 n=1 Tax=Prunus dulcis TaxID=3755 RepID=UPI0014821917|nr:B3 domain-containing protein Os07g0563300 isoform X2 [Prunus dulcis]
MSSSSSKVCYNSECKELKSEHPRKGWRLRTGEYAELCDRCYLAYEEGRFCETFHMNAAGWRCCESCGKRVHCGCIVSSHAFTLLDPGGVECMTCARKNFVLTPNPAWPTSMFFHSPLSERLKDLSVKNWTHLAGSGPVPWRQAPSLFNSSIPSSELHTRVPYEVDVSTGINKLNASERIFVSSMEKKKVEDFSERLMKVNLTMGTQESLENGKPGNNREEQSSSCLNISQQSASLKEDPSTPQFGPYGSVSETNAQVGVTGTNLRPTLPLAKQFNGNLQNGVESSADTQIRNARPRADARGRNQLLPRYWPRFTDQELQQISGDKNSVITPLFEKMLSASDAGRIGRLVLPKKCAEAYFPPISQPEGLPLKVQDSKGKEWVFQFRFWPNNNSRMYVLEGVTPCIQSMQLQAGDIVTFSRLEPEGKLVMGFRKASTAPPSDQDAPILGMPTIYATGSAGEKIQWAQCEDCFKWRKLPMNALLPSKWTCSDNSWDPERSSCSAAQDLTTEQLEDLLPSHSTVTSKKMKAAKQDPDNIEALEGLDTLANLAILGEGESLPASAQATTKHPRHRPGCSCIVCIQPPSGKGPKHKQTCTCNVCLTVKRRFRTLMMRREKKQSEKEAESTRKKQQQQQLVVIDKVDDDTPICCNAGSSSPNQKKEVLELSDDDLNRTKSSTPPFKGQIDLNIQPEREEELSPGSDSGSMMKLLQDATERYLKQQRLSSSGGSENSSGNRSQQVGGEAGGGEPLSNGVTLGSSNHDGGNDCPATLSIKASASMTATG